MNKKYIRFAHKAFNSAVKELRRNTYVTHKTYLFDEEGKIYTFTHSHQNDFEKMFEMSVVKEMCKKINAQCVVYVMDSFIGSTINNIRPSLDFNRKEAITVYYEDPKKNFVLMRKYCRTGHNKIIFTGKSKIYRSIEGPLTNFLQDTDKDLP